MMMNKKKGYRLLSNPSEIMELISYGDEVFYFDRETKEFGTLNGKSFSEIEEAVILEESRRVTIWTECIDITQGAIEINREQMERYIQEMRETLRRWNNAG
jgi:hypothetical protein